MKLPDRSIPPRPVSGSPSGSPVKKDAPWLNLIFNLPAKARDEKYGNYILVT